MSACCHAAAHNGYLRHHCYEPDQRSTLGMMPCITFSISCTAWSSAEVVAYTVSAVRTTPSNTTKIPTVHVFIFLRDEGSTRTSIVPSQSSPTTTFICRRATAVSLMEPRASRIVGYHLPLRSCFHPLCSSELLQSGNRLESRTSHVFANWYETQSKVLALTPRKGNT